MNTLEPYIFQDLVDNTLCPIVYISSSVSNTMPSLLSVRCLIRMTRSACWLFLRELENRWYEIVYVKSKNSPRGSQETRMIELVLAPNSCHS